MKNQNNTYDVIKFEDGEFSLDVNVSPSEDTVWLTQEQISTLYQKAKSTINEHIKKILAFELDAKEVSKKFGKTELSSIKTKPITFYNLDMILAIGYRVNSKRGILFRKWATSILKQYLLNGYSINEKRCLDCQENIVNLNNKVDYLFKQNEHTLSRLNQLEKIETILTDKLFYENQIFDAYSYIKQLFLSATSSIILIDGYIDLSVLDMLNDVAIPITVYTYPNTTISNQDIERFNINHTLSIIKTNKIHDRFIIIDDKIYLCGSSIKDVGKKRFVLTKLEAINVNDLLKNL